MEFLILSLLGLGGIVLHVFLKFRDAVSKQPKRDPNTDQAIPTKERLSLVWLNFDVLGNVSYAAFAIFVVLICVVIRDKLSVIGFPITYITIVFVGYAADSAVKNIKPENLDE